MEFTVGMAIGIIVGSVSGFSLGWLTVDILRAKGLVR